MYAMLRARLLDAVRIAGATGSPDASDAGQNPRRVLFPAAVKLLFSRHLLTLHQRGTSAALRYIQNRGQIPKTEGIRGPLVREAALRPTPSRRAEGLAPGRPAPARCPGCRVRASHNNFVTRSRNETLTARAIS
jgi:hypothetical protein